LINKNKNSLKKERGVERKKEEDLTVL